MAALGGAGPNPVDGVSYPEHFRFRETVPDDDPQEPAGGWRAVCIHAQSQRGTEVAALFYSLIETAKLRGEDPGDYLLRAALAAIEDPGTVTLPSGVD